MSYSTYIIKSDIDGSFYIGYSKDPEDRVLRHNSAKTGYTSRKQPWKLMYTEVFETKTEAIKRENSLRNRRIENSIKDLLMGMARMTVPSTREGRGFPESSGSVPLESHGEIQGFFVLCSCIVYSTLSDNH